MRINVAIPEAHVDAPVLDAALEAVTRLNQSMLKRGEIPTFDRMISNGLKWRPEPPGQEHFDHGGLLVQRGAGDCDDIAPMHAASLRHTGTDPKATAIVKRSGPNLWHAVVRRGDGTIDDPSLRAGMKPGITPFARGAVVPLMAPPHGVVGGIYTLRPNIALRPVAGGELYQARCDMPWHWQAGPHEPLTPGGMALATRLTAPTAAEALSGCIDGACDLAISGEYADDDHIKRVRAVADCVDGMDHDELAYHYGQDDADAAVAVVGSFFSGLAHALHSALPIASKALQFVPGVGPVASSALDMASHLLPSGPDAAAAAALLPHLAPHLSNMHPGGSSQICIPVTHV